MKAASHNKTQIVHHVQGEHHHSYLPFYKLSEGLNHCLGLYLINLQSSWIWRASRVNIIFISNIIGKVRRSMPRILIWKYFYKWITIESLIYFFFALKCIEKFERFCTICIIVFLMLQLILLRSQDSLFLCAKCSEMWNKNLEYNKHIWMHLFIKMYVLFTKTIL